METEVPIPQDPHEVIPGKDKSIAQIDEIQRRQEAAIEIQQAYRGYFQLWECHKIYLL